MSNYDNNQSDLILTQVDEVRRIMHNNINKVSDDVYNNTNIDTIESSQTFNKTSKIIKKCIISKRNKLIFIISSFTCVLITVITVLFFIRLKYN